MLYIVATPIGNLQDITFRALEILKTVDYIVCEDTRHTSKLLFHFGISKPLISYHSYSNDSDLDKILNLLKESKTCAYVSDAGTPGISDPGYKLINMCVKNSIQVVPIPGVSAFTTALMASGIPINRFWYYGFLPVKKGKETLLKLFSQTDSTIVFYESPYRILKTLEKISSYMPDRQMVIARELTKVYEEYIRGTTIEVYEKLKVKDKIKGEIVVILAPIDWK